MDMLFRQERGQGLLEYGMAIVLIAVVVIIALTVLGRATSDLFENVINTV